MRTRASTWTIALVIAGVHFVLCLACAFTGFSASTLIAYEWPIRVISWIGVALALPLLFALHDSSMPAVDTVVLMATNSAAVGLIAGLLLGSVRGWDAKPEIAQ